jgi:dinuclear metal center YbgI/SA1388 family protein
LATTVADIIALMEKIAPAYLAEDWDNPGLQVGRRDRVVKKIRIALDPLPQVIEQACSDGVNLLITHHPLIFKPLKSVDLSTPIGRIVDITVRHQLAVFSAHTNLDSASGGINDVLASLIGLKDIRVLSKMQESPKVKLVVYVPADYEMQVLNALFEAETEKIGEYSCCSFRHPGTGTFKPGDAANPFIGKRGEVSHVNEVRIECLVPKADIHRVIRHIRASHPYEAMAYDVYPLTDTGESAQGLGRIGTLETDMTLADLAMLAKKNLNLTFLKIVGEPNMPVRKAALCSGGGSSLMKDFFRSDAQVYISGDLRYHDALDALAAGRALLDVGHFSSEHIMVNILAEQLKERLASTDVEVDVCGIETDPFRIG